MFKALENEHFPHPQNNIKKSDESIWKLTQLT